MESFDFVLIDDNNLDNLINETLVRNSGVGSSVLVFNSAKSALDYFKRIPVHSSKVILLDLHMPDMEGTEFIEELNRYLKNRKAMYKYILLTQDEEFVKQKGNTLSSPAQEVWCKPLKIANLERLQNERSAD